MSDLIRRTHPFARLLFVCATVYVLVVPLGTLALYVVATRQDPPSATKLGLAALQVMTDGLIKALGLAAAGIVIDLLDAIRWTLLLPDERPAMQHRTLGAMVRALRTGRVVAVDEPTPPPPAV